MLRILSKAIYEYFHFGIGKFSLRALGSANLAAGRKRATTYDIFEEDFAFAQPKYKVDFHKI